MMANEKLPAFRREYSKAFRHYLARPDEIGLEAAYELGRRALNDQLGALDIAQVHHEELALALMRKPTIDEGIAGRAATFFNESLSTFEMTQRGYFEAQRLYERERDIAATLEQSLLPDRLAAIPGLRAEAFYRPGGFGNQVGGDFYDVFRIDDNSWGVLIGDVCGKGPKAASLTALARHTMRAGAIIDPSPGAVLDLLNRAILQYGDDNFCTVLYMYVEKTPTGPLRLTIASGGHPPPLLLHPDGRVETVPAAGMMMGVSLEADSSSVTFDLGAGDSLALYTDGVIEARIRSGFFGERRLAAILESCASLDCSKILSSITAELEEVMDETRRDDIAILILQADGEEQMPDGRMEKASSTT